jgi:hypothetical protein
MWNDSNVRKNVAYDVYWVQSATSIVDLGGTDEVTPDIPLLISPVKIGSAGPQKLDDWIDGVGDGATVKLALREQVRRRLERLAPWFSTTTLTTAIPVVPVPGTRLYQYAKPLILHPTDLAVTNQDLLFHAAVPMPPGAMKRTGTEFDKFEAQFMVYPDRTKLLAGTAAVVEFDALGPLAPTGCAAVSAGATSATVTWACAAADETGFEVWTSTGNGEWTRFSAPAANATTETVTALTTGTQTYFMVRSMRSGVRSAFSNVAFCTPTA